MLKVVGVILMGLFGVVCIQAGVTVQDWEFFALLAIVICYGMVKFVDGCGIARPF